MSKLMELLTDGVGWNWNPRGKCGHTHKRTPGEDWSYAATRWERCLHQVLGW